MTSTPTAPLGTSDRPIFVVGAPRSGTTMFQLMLHAHPRLAIPPENRFVLPVYDARHRFGDLNRRRNRRRVGDFIVHERKHRFRDLGLDPRATIAAVADGPPTIGSAIGIVLREYAERFGKPRWGDKRPAYYLRLDVLLRMFPDAQVIHVIRDPRASVASLKAVGWAKLPIHHAIARWGEAIRYVERFDRDHPGVVTTVRYERLVTEPEVELRALCTALAEEFDAAMLAPHELAPVAVPQRKVWHHKTWQPPDPGNVDRWSARLEPWEVALCEAALHRPMRRLGYHVSDAGRPPLVEYARYLRVAAERELHHRRQWRAELRSRRAEPNPVAALLTPGQRGLG